MTSVNYIYTSVAQHTERFTHASSGIPVHHQNDLYMSVPQTTTANRPITSHNVDHQKLPLTLSAYKLSLNKQSKRPTCKQCILYFAIDRFMADNTGHET